MGHFQTIRFHKATGPASLFARVQQKMATKTGLNLHGLHFRQRANQRSIDKRLINDFPSDAWELMEAEVRTDTGKFVSSSWRRRIDNWFLWIVVGFGETVKTAYWSNSEMPGPDIQRESSFYFFVEEVNKRLLAEGDSDPKNISQPNSQPQPAQRKLRPRLSYKANHL